MSRRGCENHTTTHRCNAGVGKPTTTRHRRNESATATMTMPCLTAATLHPSQLTPTMQPNQDAHYGPTSTPKTRLVPSIGDMYPLWTTNTAYREWIPPNNHGSAQQPHDTLNPRRHTAHPRHIYDTSQPYRPSTNPTAAS